MKIYRKLVDIENKIDKACVTIGNFDGVHLGHQLLFKQVVDDAKKIGGTSVVITFNPHPLQILRSEGIKLISTCEQKAELVEMMDIDVLLVIPFDKEFAMMPAEDFVNDVLVDKIGVKKLVIGYDYAFGKGRVGDAKFLKKQGENKGFSVNVVDALYRHDMLVSSTAIRSLVSDGRMVDVRKVLGRYYQIIGDVQVGQQRGGKEMGFPTANLHLDEKHLVPKRGVYVTQVIYDGKCYGGVLNIGVNPTFGGDKIIAETHIFDFNHDIYGKSLKINLLRFLRSERKFPGIRELVDQIKYDVERAKKELAKQSEELICDCAKAFNK